MQNDTILNELKRVANQPDAVLAVARTCTALGAPDAARRAYGMLPEPSANILCEWSALCRISDPMQSATLALQASALDPCSLEARRCLLLSESGEPDEIIRACIEAMLMLTIVPENSIPNHDDFYHASVAATQHLANPLAMFIDPATSLPGVWVTRDGILRQALVHGELLSQLFQQGFDRFSVSATSVYLHRSTIMLFREAESREVMAGDKCISCKQCNPATILLVRPGHLRASLVSEGYHGWLPTRCIAGDVLLFANSEENMCTPECISKLMVDAMLLVGLANAISIAELQIGLRIIDIKTE